jgi:hypothetical protein
VERELTIAMLTLAACGPAVLVAGSLIPAAAAPDSARDLEAHSARRVWWPAFAALVPLGVVLGWGLQEPDVTGEALGPVVRTIAVVFGAVWVRALLRAAQSLFLARRSPRAARTVGLMRPRVIIPPELANRLDDAELAAAFAHEQAHARHRDPLRVWIAQLITDLQWPFLPAKRRLDEWRHALELARDDEARERGIPGEDLASAILEAARFAVEGRFADAGLSDGPRLAERVARLLSPRRAAAARPSRSSSVVLVLAAAVVLAVATGATFGEAAFRLLPGVRH